jgi:alkaline phosphatase D
VRARKRISLKQRVYAEVTSALGRELEIADLLSFIRRQRMKNTAWFTADVNYTAAHYYDPKKATFKDFDPFWEFVSGPLNAGTFGPNTLDATFGPNVVYQRAADRPNQPPYDGFQFFGHVEIAGDTGVMTVTLKDLAGDTLYSVELEPATQ